MLRQMKPRGPTAIRLGRRARADTSVVKSLRKLRLHTAAPAGITPEKQYIS